MEVQESKAVFSLQTSSRLAYQKLRRKQMQLTADHKELQKAVHLVLELALLSQQEIKVRQSGKVASEWCCIRKLLC